MKKVFIIFLLITQCAYTQIIDSKNSKVFFEVGNMSVRTVTGEFSDMHGSISFNESKLKDSHFDVCINTNSLRTDRKKRDQNLKNKDFFDVENHPKICFESRSIKKIFDSYIIEGYLTLMGVTKPISIPLTFSENTFNGRFEISRKDYALAKNITTFFIDDKVAISIVCKVKKDQLVLTQQNEKH